MGSVEHDELRHDKSHCHAVRPSADALQASENYGRLTFVSVAGRDRGGRQLWLCRCTCGAEKVFDRWHVTSGKTKSCGCIGIDILRSMNTKHGMSNSKTYLVWAAMKRRCLNPNCLAYKNYGGRGIKICKRWRESFAEFYNDMGDPPVGMTIDRINNDGHYKPSNCRWVTMKQNSRNMRKTHWITIGKKTKSLADWCDKDSAVPYKTVSRRLQSGWDARRALFTPYMKDPRKYGKKNHPVSN